MRVVRDLLKEDRQFKIEGTNITVQFKDYYAEIEDKYAHHFQFYANFDVLPIGSKIPILAKKLEVKPIDVKTEKSDNKDIKIENPKK